MFDKLERFRQGGPPPVSREIVDPVLGTLSWSKDEEAWLSSPEHHDIGFTFQIAGTPRPDVALVRHATDITQKKDQFVSRVQHFLSEEAALSSASAYKEEVAALSIETVCLFWTD